MRLENGSDTFKDKVSQELLVVQSARKGNTSPPSSRPGTPAFDTLPGHYSPQIPMQRSRSAIKKDVMDQKNDMGIKLIVVMVGLPARGKSYICKKLTRYLCWVGFHTKVFNVGNRRRVKSRFLKSSEMGSLEGLGIQDVDLNKTEPPVVTEKSSNNHDANFFDPSNTDAKNFREQLALECLDELLAWLKTGGGKIGILDATNTTVERRAALCEHVAKTKNHQILFIESICTDKKVLESNIEMKLNGPDYKSIPRQDAIRDFKKRIENYEQVYETIGDEEEARNLSYVKIINIGKKVITHNIQGYLQSQCVFYLMQLNLHKRTIWLTRHGESDYNVEGRIGGDPSLTDEGRVYGRSLGHFLKSYYSKLASELSIKRTENSPQLTDDNFGAGQNESLINLWTSTLRRTLDTVEEFDESLFDIKTVRFLNEIYAGRMENLTYQEFEDQYPEEYHERSRNKLTYRYPGAGGESYLDVIERLRPLIIELERMESDTIIVTHNVVMRTLVAYFLGLPLEKMCRLNIPLHTLYKLEPTPYGCDLSKYKLDPSTGQLVQIPD